MKDSEETFVLTAVNERTVKLPKIGSASRVMTRTHRYESLSVRRLKRNASNANVSQSKKETFEWLDEIKEKANEYFLHSEIQLLFSKNTPSELLSTISRLENSDFVKEIIGKLRATSLGMKKTYNSLVHVKGSRAREIASLKAKLEELRIQELGVIARTQELESANDQSNSLIKRVLEDKMAAETLKHMVNVRQKSLMAYIEPTRQARKQLLDTHSKLSNLDKETGYHSSNSKFQQTELNRIQEDLNLQKEDMRKALASELSKFEARSKALAFYKQSQLMWYKQKEVLSKEDHIKELEEVYMEQIKESELQVKLAKIQEELTSKESYIARALSSTNTNSLEELGQRIEKLKETKLGLLELQRETTNTLREQNDLTIELNEKYDKILTESQRKDTSTYKVLYSLETELSTLEHHIEMESDRLNQLSKDSSYVILGVGRLIQTVGGLRSLAIKPIRTTDEALDFLCRKIEEFQEGQINN